MPMSSAISFCSILGLSSSSLRARRRAASSSASSRSMSRRARSRRAARFTLSNSSLSRFSGAMAAASSAGSASSAASMASAWSAASMAVSSISVIFSFSSQFSDMRSSCALGAHPAALPIGRNSRNRAFRPRESVEVAARAHREKPRHHKSTSSSRLRETRRCSAKRYCMMTGNRNRRSIHYETLSLKPDGKHRPRCCRKHPRAPRSQTHRTPR